MQGGGQEFLSGSVGFSEFWACKQTKSVVKSGEFNLDMFMLIEKVFSVSSQSEGKDY